MIELDFLSDLGAHALGWLLGRFRDELEATPERDWSEIGWLHRFGRLLLIATFLGVIFVPPAWLMLR